MLPACVDLWRLHAAVSARVNRVTFSLYPQESIGAGCVLPSCEIIWGLSAAVSVWKNQLHVCASCARFVSNMICVCSCEQNTWTSATRRGVYYSLIHFLGKRLRRVAVYPYICSTFEFNGAFVLSGALTGAIEQYLWSSCVCVLRSLWFALCMCLVQ